MNNVDRITAYSKLGYSVHEINQNKMPRCDKCSIYCDQSVAACPAIIVVNNVTCVVSDPDNLGPEPM